MADRQPVKEYHFIINKRRYYLELHKLTDQYTYAAHLRLGKEGAPVYMGTVKGVELATKGERGRDYLRQTVVVALSMGLKVK